MCGAPLWGFIADRFGRWPTMLIVLSMISYFGVLTSCAPNYPWVIILRLIVGFAIGGANSSFTLLSEFLTVKHRAKVLLAFNFLPESPRFLVSAGKIEEAERIIADLFRANRVAPLQGTLVSAAVPVSCI
ncbi:unnamed protein product [Trichobilharzia regenti]|nr:unnamed protein product [Trichobilharzia regenti]